MIAVEVVVSVLAVLLWVLAGVAAIALAVLGMPICISGSVKGLRMSESAGANLEETEWRLGADGLLGLVVFGSTKEAGAEPRFELRLAGISRAIRSGGATRGRRQQPAAKAKPKRKGRRGLSFWEVRSLLPELRGLIARLWRSLRLEARGEIVYGLEDPYATGWCEALRSMVSMPYELKITPDFLEARLEGWADVRMTVYPIMVAGVLVGTLFRRGVRRIWWSRVKTRLARSS